MQNTISRNVSTSSPIFAPAIGNGILLLIAGAAFLFYYIPQPTTQTLSKSLNVNANVRNILKLAK